MRAHIFASRALVGAAAAIALLSTTAARAQQGTLPQSLVKPVSTPLRVDVVLSRFQGEKKVSSLPFSVTPTSGPTPATSNRVSLRVGVDVPIGTETVTRGNTTTTGQQTTSTEVTYRNVGTSIDCSVLSADDGRFKVSLAIQDSSIVSSAGAENASSARAGEPPAFRSFSLNNELTLRDGQTTQIVMATDKITGEVLKVDVTLTVIK